MNLRSVILGVMCWMGAIGAVWFAVQRELAPSGHSVSTLTGGVGQWVTGQRQKIRAVAPNSILLANGDPVLLRLADGTFRQIGVVRNNYSRTADSLYTREADVIVYDAALKQFPDGFEFQYFASPTSLDWVASTMISPQRQEQIAAIIAADWEIHQAEILRNLTPVVQESVQRMITAVESELPTVMTKHRQEFAKLGDRYKDEIFRDQLMPLVKDKILPIIEEEAKPLAGEIGRSLWDRVSLWSFTWRYFYDVSPLPQRNVLQNEFDRFLEKEAIPELKSRSGQFAALTERIFDRVTSDPEISHTIRRSVRQVSSDPRLHSLVWKVIRDAVLNNEKLRASLEEYWNSEETRRAMHVATSRFEPTARAIGDLILGSKEKGMPPEFARVLRLQILLKDRHWLVLSAPTSAANGSEVANGAGVAKSRAKPTSGSPVPIVISSTEMMYPIRFEGTDQSPLTKIQ